MDTNPALIKIQVYYKYYVYYITYNNRKRNIIAILIVYICFIMYYMLRFMDQIRPLAETRPRKYNDQSGLEQGPYPNLSVLGGPFTSLLYFWFMACPVLGQNYMDIVQMCHMHDNENVDNLWQNKCQTTSGQGFLVCICGIYLGPPPSNYFILKDI